MIAATPNGSSRWRGAQWVWMSMIADMSPVPSGPEMLRELERLRLVVRADAGAVERLRPLHHLLVDQPAYDLAVLEDERHLARTHLQHGARTLAAGARIAEARVEESRIVHAELADQ